MYLYTEYHDNKQNYFLDTTNVSNSTQQSNSNSNVNIKELANRVSNILAMAKKDIDPNKISARKMIDSMYNKGELTQEEKEAVLNML